MDELFGYMNPIVWDLIHASWQSAIVAGCILAVVWGIRKMPAPLRHALLLIALVKFAVPPIIDLPVGSPLASQPVHSAQTNSTGPAAIKTVRPFPAITATAHEPVAVGSAAPVSSSTQVPTSTPIDAPEPHSGITWVGWLSLLYLGGTFSVVMLLAFNQLRVLELVRSCRPIPAGPVLDRYDALRERMGVSKKVQLLSAPNGFSPMAVGLFHRRILVPETLLNTLDDQEIEVVLSHELAHHRRHDTWFIALENVLLAIWWFHPIYWMVVRSLSSVREDCCDDLLLESGIADNDTYCASLLRAAAMIQRPWMPRAAIGFSAHAHPLGRRLRRIMDVSLPRHTRLSTTSVLLLALLAIGVTPGLRFVGAQEVAEEDLIAYALATAPPPMVAKAPGTLAFEGLYRHSIAGKAIPDPEHRWLMRQSDGAIAVVSDVPFMEATYYAEGGRNQGFTRYETVCWGDGRYDQQLEFKPGEAIVTLPGLGADWERKKLPVPIRAIFFPNSRPDPYCAAQVLESVLAIAPGETEQTEVYDWDKSGEAFAYYRLRIRNTGLEEVTVPCGRFNASHYVLEQLDSTDTWFSKKEKDVTDMWALEDGTIVRVFRRSDKYAVDLLEWAAPTNLPGLLERMTPSLSAESHSEVLTPEIPIALASNNRVLPCWTPTGFRMPYRAAMYLTPVRGEATGISSLGIGTGESDNTMILRQLPGNPDPAIETFAGEFVKGEIVPFCLQTIRRRSEPQWVSTTDTSYAAKVTFQDPDGTRNGEPVVVQTAPGQWVMYLDDADPFTFDDDDSDIKILIRLERL